METRHDRAGGTIALRRVKRASDQGTVMVVPSPVAVMENVPAVLEV
jgi:hypothetical protein